MIILGIDPGIAIVGFGVIEKINNQNKVIDYGVITTPKELSTPERLSLIYKGMLQLFEKFKPDSVAIEELFFAKNVKTAINVAQARGVILLACTENCSNLFEYTPLQIKQAMTGYGRADKNQIQQMVKVYLGLEKIPKPDDAADALAVAITHAQTRQTNTSFKI